MQSPALLSASPALGVKNFEDFRQAALPGGKLSYASWGVGGLGHPLQRLAQRADAARVGIQRSAVRQQRLDGGTGSFEDAARGRPRELGIEQQ